MSKNTIQQSVLFGDLAKKPVTVRFDQTHASSDGGVLLLKACDQRLQLSAQLAACLHDGRQSAKVHHSYGELFRHRLYAIACGYVDGNDAARLGDDPMMKMALDRDPVSGATLASQPTLSRFENAADARELRHMAEALADVVIKRHRKRRRGRETRRITIDLDPTHDPAHGMQQLSLFNRFYDTRCYLPMAGFLSFDGEADQYLFAYVLRGGDAAAKHGCVAILKRVLPKLRRTFPKADILIRLDAGFAGAELYTFFEAQALKYVVCMGKNDKLKTLCEPLMASVRDAVARGEAPEPVFGEALYQARSWSHERRVVMKADIASRPHREPKENPRFIITNLSDSPEHVYRRVYCARGDAENRIKELKDCLEIDRTSCTSFLANQLRVLMAAAAYVLFQELRLRARRTSCHRAQASTLRLRLLKLSAWVEVSVRRIVIHFPSTAAYADQWRTIARSVGAVPI